MTKERFKETKSGYRFDRWVFRFVLFFALFYLIVVVSLHGIDFKDKAYFKCGDVMGCINPFYNMESLVRKCNYDWCSDQYLPMGSYGDPPPRAFSFFPLYVVTMLCLAVIINHLLYNKNFDFERLKENGHNNNSKD